MNTITQIFAVTMLNLRNLPQRLAASTVAVVGVASVVLVFAAVLSMATGLEKTMMAAGSEDTAVILRSGSTSELNSGLSNDQVLLVENAPGVLRDGDDAVMSVGSPCMNERLDIDETCDGQHDHRCQGCLRQVVEQGSQQQKCDNDRRHGYHGRETGRCPGVEING